MNAGKRQKIGVGLITILIVFLGACTVYDIIRIKTVSTQVQTAADNMALSVARFFMVEERLPKNLDKGFPAGEYSIDEVDESITNAKNVYFKIIYDEKLEDSKVTVRGDVDTLFLHLFGLNSLRDVYSGARFPSGDEKNKMSSPTGI